MILNKIFFLSLLFILLGAAECPNEFIQIDDGCYYKKNLDVLQDFIDVNKSLRGLEPQNIGIQEWENGKLTYLYLRDHLITMIPDSIGLLSNLNYLDMKDNKLTVIPNGICSLYPNLTGINLTNNSICPPYPYCLDYISQQNTKSCKSFKCPDEYIKIEGECYNEEHIKVLQTIIANNESLNGLTALDLGQDIGYQYWENGKLIILNLMSNGLTSLPEDICRIYPELKSFDVSNNFICPPYPSCIAYLGKQQTDEKCYFKKDLQVLFDFIKLNPEIKDYQPLMLGHQIWKDNRLQLLHMDGLEISNVPESIQNLERLEYLDLSNNKLETLPETLCEIYSNLIWIDLSDNYLCPSYVSCFDYIGQQNTEHCRYDYCPLGYKKYNDECYSQKDLDVLQNIIDENVSLSGRNPLEIGVQKWNNMRLDFLYLGVNELTVIPESICEIYTNLSAINISRNKICPPYPACIKGIVSEQDTSSCP